MAYPPRLHAEKGLYHILSEGYLAELSRYIHLNPVRAGMTAKPETYRWSSLKSYARRGGKPATDREEARRIRILRAVAERYGVEREALGRKHAKRSVTAKARLVAMALLRRETTMTYRQIGELLGGVSAPAAASAVRRVASTPALQASAESLANIL